MKQSFNQFAMRFLTAILCGLLLLLLHGIVAGGPFAVFVPQCGSAWELSKLAFWPLLASCLLTGRLGKVKRPVPLPILVVTPAALILADWAVLALAGSCGLVCVALWVAAVAASLAFAPEGGGKHRKVFLALAVVLAAAYVLLTWRSPLWGPFLDPRDVAAMATIPF